MHKGSIVEDSEQKPGAWRKLLKAGPWVLAILTTLVAVLSNLNQLQTFLDWGWATPQAEISSAVLPIRCVQNEERVLEIKIHNTSKATATITDLEAKPSQGDLVILEAKLGPLAPLQPGELRPVGCQILPKSSGKQQISFTGKVRAGRFRGRASLSAASLDIDVWPSFNERPEIMLDHANGKAASFVITARHGKPTTKRARYQATGPANLTFLSIEGGKIKTQSKRGQGSSVIIWEEENVPLTMQRFTLFVTNSTEHSDQEWKTYEEQIEVTAEPTFEP
jgi:hypothetical protein